ncbi:MAG: hypothetical protein H0Z28_11830 [Archaeoglobus sp.]|nr:hypothetical protein [Archaeoglobus sp.]
MTESQKKNKFHELGELLKDPFASLLTLYLIFILIDTIWDGKVSKSINLNYFLIFVIATGILSFIKKDYAKKETIIEPITKSDYFFIGALSVIGSLIVWYKLRNIGTLSYIISILAGILIFLLSVLVLEEEGEEKEGGETADDGGS